MTIATEDHVTAGAGRFEVCMIITAAIMVHERPSRQSARVRILRRSGVTLERGVRVNTALQLLPETGEMGILHELSGAYNPLLIARFLDGIEDRRFRWTYREIADLFRSV